MYCKLNYCVVSNERFVHFTNKMHAISLQNSSRTTAPSTKSLCGMLRRSETSRPCSLLRASAMLTGRVGL